MVRGVTRASGWATGRRMPAYTRFAPLLKASSTSARPNHDWPQSPERFCLRWSYVLLSDEFRAVEDVEAAAARKWAHNLRPVRGTAGVDTEVTRRTRHT